MDELIRKQDAIEAIARDIPFITFTEDPKRTAQRIIGTVPSADRPTGEWIVDISDYKSVCSVCGAKETDFIYGTEMWYGLGESKFCPNCGAKMVREDGEEE